MSASKRAVQTLALVLAVVAGQPEAWATDISAGDSFSCGVNVSGAARCWGSNTYGVLGIGTSGGAYLTPVTVSGLGSGVARVSAGLSSACAVTTAGAVLCWGQNGEGQLGIGTLASSSVPVQVTGLTSGVRSVHVGINHACAVTTSGLLYCWGRGGEGQLGTGSNQRQLTPVQVPGLSGVVTVATGGHHTCALLNTGAVRCFGDNLHGQLGIGSSGGRYLSPVQPSGLSSGVTGIAAGSIHSCALMSTGSVLCWGDNDLLTLGTNDSADRSSPTQVLVSNGSSIIPLSGQSAISAGGYMSCSLGSSVAYCWGMTQSSVLASPRIATRVNNDTFSRLESGTYHTCGFNTSGVARCWGGNAAGRLGNNSTTSSYMTPVSVVGF